MKNIIHGIGTISIVLFPLFLSVGMMSLINQNFVLSIILFSITLFMGIFIYLLLTNKYFSSSFRSIEEEINQTEKWVQEQL